MPPQREAVFASVTTIDQERGGATPPPLVLSRQREEELMPTVVDVHQVSSAGLEAAPVADARAIKVEY
jgi:hypothetical protein